MESKIEAQPNPKILNIPDLMKEDIPSFFANGFQAGFTMSDAHLIFKAHNEPQFIVNLGLPALKSLYSNIAQLLSTYEKVTGEKIVSMEELNKKVDLSQIKK
ncbi:hypothetical protein [Pedobacter kyonggii]|uniref:DUF3467 domain-containing protein n=1 Tax=Pedobacter kyonggii TaxID=1926871 RepID=A0A4Q9H6E8_9SPHI|nr:hypothetical protein [Pedobacter kyonggii]TBO35943.1 hypothetical protein EYS08_25385 [Pedobacter kyonggii]